jgi:hypothetical protein
VAGHPSIAWVVSATPDRPKGLAGQAATLYIFLNFFFKKSFSLFLFLFKFILKNQ